MQKCKHGLYVSLTVTILGLGFISVSTPNVTVNAWGGHFGGHFGGEGHSFGHIFRSHGDDSDDDGGTTTTRNYWRGGTNHNNNSNYDDDNADDNSWIPSDSNYDQNSYFQDPTAGFISQSGASYGNVIHSKDKKGHDLVALGGNYNRLFEYQKPLTNAGYTKSGFRFSAMPQGQHLSGIFKSPASGDKLTAKQLDQYAKNGSNSYWSPYHVYYPGTSGYLAHLNYYSDDTHSFTAQQSNASREAINDELNILNTNTKTLFENQEIAYENAEVQPHIFVYTDDAGSVSAPKQYSSVAYDTFDSTINKGPSLIVAVFGNDGHYKLTVYAEGQMKNYIPQSTLNQLLNQILNGADLNSPNSVNQVLSRLATPLTQLVWQKYVAPNLTNVDQYNQGKLVPANNSLMYQKIQSQLQASQNQDDKNRTLEMWVGNGFLFGFIICGALLFKYLMKRK